MLTEIWLTGAAAAPMRRVPAGLLVAGAGLDGDRYALGGGTWARYPDLEKQLTLIDSDAVAAVAAEVGAEPRAGDTRRNLVTVGVDLPALVGRWFAVGDAVLFGMKRLPALRPPGTADPNAAGEGDGAPRRDQRGGSPARRSRRAPPSSRCRTPRRPGAGCRSEPTARSPGGSDHHASATERSSCLTLSSDRRRLAAARVRICLGHSSMALLRRVRTDQP